MALDALNVAGVAVSADHYIDGRRVTSSQCFELFSPIDQRLLGKVAEGLPEHVEQAVTAAQRAFPAWAALTAAQRKPVLDRFAEEIGKRAEALCTLESNDAGVLLSRMRHGVVPRAMQNISWFAQHALGLQDRTIETEQAHHRVRHDPCGVVVIITPWNAPLMLSTWKLGPALAAGNTVHHQAPRVGTADLFDAGRLRAHAAGLPPGVVNIVQGSGRGHRRGPRVANPGPGPHLLHRLAWARPNCIAQAAAANLVPCSLELGGKSPFIVLEDADHRRRRRPLAALMYRNAGQVCLAGTRLLVHEKRDARSLQGGDARHSSGKLQYRRSRATRPPKSDRSSTRARSSACKGYRGARPWQSGALHAEWGGASHHVFGAQYVPAHAW